MRSYLLITKITLLVVLVMAGFGASGQQVVFERLIDFNSSSHGIVLSLWSKSSVNFVAEDNSTKFSANGLNRISSLYKGHINLNGDTSDISFMSDSFASFYAFRAKNGNVFAFYSTKNDPNSHDTIMYSIAVWDTFFVKKHSVPLTPWVSIYNDFFNFQYVNFDNINDELYVTSRVSDALISPYPFNRINKYDSLGNLKWSRNILLPGTLINGVNYVTNGGNIAQTGYLANSNGLYLPYYCLLNPDGVIISHRSLRNSFSPVEDSLVYNFTSSNLYCFQLANGNVLTQRRVFDGRSRKTFTELCIFDSTFSLRKWRLINKRNDFSPRFIPMSDGGFLMSADSGDGQYLYKMDSLGYVSWRIRFNWMLPGRAVIIPEPSALFDDSGNAFLGGSYVPLMGTSGVSAWYAYVRSIGYPHRPSIGVNNRPPNITALKPTLPREYTAQPQPNPTANRFTIPGVGREGVLSLVNASGRVVRQESFVPGSEVDISSLPKGLYLFRLVSEGSVTQGKVVRE